MVLKLPEANLVTNLLLIDDIILMLHKVKTENFNFITKQVVFQTQYLSEEIYWGKLLKNVQSVIKIFFYENPSQLETKFKVLNNLDWREFV